MCQLALGAGYTFGPLLKEMAADLGASRGELTLGRAPQLIVQALASPLVGYFCVRFGPRTVLGGSVLLFGIGWSALSGIEALWQYYAINLLLGVSLAGLGDITVGAVITQWVRRGRGLALGLAYTGSNLAGAVLSPVVVMLSALGSWRTAVLVIGLGGLLLLLPFALGAVRSPRAGEGPGAEDSNEGAQPAEDEAALSLGEAVRTRSFWILGASLAVFFAYFISMIEHLVPMLTDEGIERMQAAQYLAFAIFVGGLSKILFGLVADRMHEKTGLIVDFAILALSSVLVLALPDETLIYPFLILYGLSTAARDIVYPLIITHCFGARHMAQIYGVLMLSLPAGALGSYYAASTYDYSGNYQAALQTFALLNVIIVVSLFWVRREINDAPVNSARVAPA